MAYVYSISIDTGRAGNGQSRAGNGQSRAVKTAPSWPRGSPITAQDLMHFARLWSHNYLVVWGQFSWNFPYIIESRPSTTDSKYKITFKH